MILDDLFLGDIDSVKSEDMLHAVRLSLRDDDGVADCYALVFIFTAFFPLKNRSSSFSECCGYFLWNRVSPFILGVGPISLSFCGYFCDQICFFPFILHVGPFFSLFFSLSVTSLCVCLLSLKHIFLRSFVFISSYHHFELSGHTY
jgi:hypothetical protein